MKLRKRVTLCISYIGACLTALAIDSIALLGILTVPWSMPLMALSWYMVHLLDDGLHLVKIGMTAGAVLNVMLYLFFSGKENDRGHL